MRRMTQFKENMEKLQLLDPLSKNLILLNVAFQCPSEEEVENGRRGMVHMNTYTYVHIPTQFSLARNLPVLFMLR